MLAEKVLPPVAVPLIAVTYALALFASAELMVTALIVSQDAKPVLVIVALLALIDVVPL